MGHAVEEVALARGHEIVARIDPVLDSGEVTPESLDALARVMKDGAELRFADPRAAEAAPLHLVDSPRRLLPRPDRE